MSVFKNQFEVQMIMMYYIHCWISDLDNFTHFQTFKFHHALWYNAK